MTDIPAGSPLSTGPRPENARPENAQAESVLPGSVLPGSGLPRSVLPELTQPESRRRTLRAAGLIVVSLAVIGIGQGVLWAAVAPGQQAKVFADGSYASLPTADYHPFVDVAIFVLSGLVIGVLAATLIWRVRSIRGSATLLAVVGGCALGALIAYLLGPALVSGVDPATIGKTGAEHIVTAAPKLATALVLVVQPGLAAAVYTFLAAWNGTPRLGRADLAPEAVPAVDQSGG